MLEKIIEKLFTRNPEAFYLRRLARESGGTPKGVFKQLQVLAGLGLVRQHGLSFAAEPRHPLYPVLCGLIEQKP